MRKAVSLPIRLDPETKLRLQNAAEAMGLTVSALIRLLVKSFVEEYDRCGGQIVLPPQWKTASEPPPQAGLYDTAAKMPLRKAAEEKRPSSRSRSVSPLKDVCGCVDSGVSDLASNPKHMKGFGGNRISKNPDERQKSPAP